MNRPYKYVTVLDYSNGQVYLYDYDETKMPMFNAAKFVELRHGLDKVNYMVHQYKPALWTKDLYYCKREQAYQLTNENEL